MDADRFDGLTRALRATPTRRLTLRALTVLGMAAIIGADEAATRLKRKDNKKKDKKKKDKKKKRCRSEFPLFCPGLGCCPGYLPTCCPGGCAKPGYACCSAAQGGGSCGPDTPQCCGPTSKFPQGYCVANGTLCCSPAKGGSCPVDVPVCCPAGTGPQNGPNPGCCQADFPICCPKESNACAPEGGSCCTAAQGGGSCGPGETCTINGCV